MIYVIRAPRSAHWTGLDPVGHGHRDRALKPIASGDAAGSVRDMPLAGLAGSSMSHRFRAWSGSSGRRYIFSVFALGTDGPGPAGLPAEAAAVVVAAERQGGETRRVLWVDETGAAPHRFFRSARVQELLRREGCELHLHLLATNPDERAAIVLDLRAGHLS